MQVFVEEVNFNLNKVGFSFCLLSWISTSIYVYLKRDQARKLSIYDFTSKCDLKIWGLLQDLSNVIYEHEIFKNIRVSLHVSFEDEGLLKDFSNQQIYDF